jgi:hypothetical protein
LQHGWADRLDVGAARGDAGAGGGGGCHGVNGAAPAAAALRRAGADGMEAAGRRRSSAVEQLIRNQ